MENELEAYYQAEQEKLEAQERRLKKMQKKMAADEMRVLRGEAEVVSPAMRAEHCWVGWGWDGGRAMEGERGKER
eukprot:87976-Chlamydomonas_euryale.AAC.1